MTSNQTEKYTTSPRFRPNISLFEKKRWILSYMTYTIIDGYRKFYARMANKIGLILVSVFVTVFTLYKVFSSVHVIPVHVDEVSWFFHTEFYQLLLSGNSDSPKWQSYESYDHPQLSKYIYGFYLNQIDKHVVRERQELERTIGRWDFYFNDNFLSEIPLKLRSYIHSMRDINTFFVIATIGLLWAILWKTTSHSWVTFLLPIVLVRNELFMEVMLRATSDAQTLFFINLSWYILLQYIENKKYLHITFFGIISAIAISSKLSGLISSMTYGMYTIFSILLERNLAYKKIVLHTISVIMLICTIWIVVNPALYSNSYHNSYRYITFRQKQSKIFQLRYPEISLHTMASKGFALWCTVFSPGCTGSFSKSYLTPYWAMNTSLAIIGLGYMLLQMYHRRRLHIFLLNSCFSYMSIVLVLVYAPVYMDRYFLNISSMIAFLQVLGIFAITSHSGKLLYKKITPPF